MSTAPPNVGAVKALMTADEFWEFVHRPENESRRFDLIRGEVVEVSRPQRHHGIVVGRLCAALNQYAESVGRGYVITESGVVLGESPATVVGPDAAYFTDADRYEDVHPKWGDVPPVLAVEVRSPNDRMNAVIAKITEYLTAGVQLVWLIDPEDRTTSVFRPNLNPVPVPAGGELTGGDVLPGLVIRLADLFRLPGERPAAPPPPPAAP